MLTTYKIFPIYLGEIPVHDKSSFTYMVEPGVKMTCPFISFLLLGSNGRKILVDTGPCDAEWGAKYHMPLNIPDGCEIVEVLRRDFDLAPGDLDYIINTHLHWDHSCGNHKFPGKKIYVQASELEYALDPLPIHRATYESPQYGVVSSWMRARDQLVTVDGDTEIDDGIRLILLPGHSDGIQGVLVSTEDGPYLLAGDCINLYQNWEGNGKLRHIIGGLHSDVKAYFKTYEKIEALEQAEHIKIIPGHDVHVLDHKVYPVSVEEGSE